jgi:hypothetical protein
MHVRTGGVLMEAVQADDEELEDWLLTSLERGNPATILDERHAGKAAWSAGNQVRPLVHGAVYFAELLAGVNELRAGDSLLFTDWRGDCDELLAGAGSEVAHVLCAAARRGVLVRGLVWRSHPDRMRFSARENRHLGDVIEAAGGECLLDTRVRPGGSHHQKFVVLRHPARPGWTWHTSAGSTWRTAATTTPATRETRRLSRSPPSTGTGHPGMTYRWRSAARRSAMWRPSSVSDGRIRLR